MPDSEYSVLALDVDEDVVGQHLREEGWNSNTEIDVHAIFNLLASSGSDAVPDLVLMIDSSYVVSIGQLPLLDRTEFHLPLHLHMVNEGEPLNHALGVLASRIHLVNAVNVERWDVNGLRVELARLYDLFHLSNHAVSRCRHISVEVTCSFMELKITHCIGPFGFYESKICK